MFLEFKMHIKICPKCIIFELHSERYLGQKLFGRLGKKIHNSASLFICLHSTARKHRVRVASFLTKIPTHSVILLVIKSSDAHFRKSFYGIHILKKILVLILLKKDTCSSKSNFFPNKLLVFIWVHMVTAIYAWENLGQERTYFVLQNRKSFPPTTKTWVNFNLYCL